MSTKITPIRFSEGRKHKFRQSRSSIKGLSNTQIYERKQAQRRKRAEEAARSEKINAYIEWIVGIQRKLHLSNESFARKLGVTAQTVRLWKRKAGHYPSERAFKKLLQLEREANIPFYFTKIRYGIKF